MSKNNEEEKPTIEITKFPIKDLSSPNCPSNDSEGFLFLEVPDINSLLYLGGSSTENFGLYLFNIINSSWSKSELKGDILPLMQYFAGWYDPPYLFIHGGKSLQDNKSLKETYLIDISSMTTHKIFTIEEPSSRYGHSAVKNNDKQAYIFGGCNIGKKNERYLNDLHKMEYKNISVITENSNINGASWIVNIQTKGEKPPGRKGYSMQYIEWINSLIIYGGELKDNKINDDSIYLFNIDEKEYTKINIKENNLIGFRAYNTMHYNDTDNKIYIIGGVDNNKEVLNDIVEIDINNKEDIKMQKIEATGNELLNKRYGHKGCNIFFNGDNENELLYHVFIFGGKKNENEYHDNSLIDLFIKSNSVPNNANDNNNKNNNQKEINHDSDFIIEDIKNEDIEENMNKLLNNKEDIENENVNDNNDNENTLPLKLTNDIILNKKNSIPTSNRTIFSNHNANSNIDNNNINNDIYDIKKDLEINENKLEIQKKKKEYISTLINQQKEFIEKYNKYQKIKEEYLSNQNYLRDLENKELERKIKGNLNKNKNKENISKLGKIKGEIATIKKKIKENKNYNELLNEYMNIYKERFCFLSDFLGDYIGDIMRIDNLLMEFGLNSPNINFESFCNKRKRYKMLVINLCRDVKVYNIFEKDLYDKIMKIKEFEQGYSENNSYRNTVQKVNKK